MFETTEVNKRKLNIGLELISKNTGHIRVWAPKRKSVSIVFENNNNKMFEAKLNVEGDGYFSATLNNVQEGDLYKLKLDEGDSYPDPASRYQPDGPFGPSMVVDYNKFNWTDSDWKGVPDDKFIYEMHIGTFTKDGTWSAAEKELKELADFGVTIIEMMPICEFAGRFGWGYDGVDFFAPYHYYGKPEDLKSFINTAHNIGIAVILDAVYNHLGPRGNFLKEFSEDYFTDKHKTDWGEAINFYGKNSKEVRNFFLSNVNYWMEEYHFDGLRFDATQDVHDKSKTHILIEMSDEVRRSGKGRKTFIVAENEPQNSFLVRPKEEKGYGMDALWNDDFHHSANVVLTGRNEAYYTDYLGKPQEFISALKYGYLYQGQWYKWQKKRRGVPAFDLPHEHFVNYIQNHDQVANSGRGERCHSSANKGVFRAMTALFILAPGIPMIFQGEEFLASCPFLYFADHDEELNKMVAEGRKKFLTQFKSIDTHKMLERLAPPSDEKTFLNSKLNFEERTKNQTYYKLHKDLIKLKFNDEIIKQNHIDGAVLSENAFVIRFFSPNYENCRILLVNFGIDLHLNPAPEPLLAPPNGKKWSILWSSEDPDYEGTGTPLPDTKDNWHIQGMAASILIPVKK